MAKTYPANKVINVIHAITGMPKGGKFLYGISGRLLEVINERRKIDGLDPVKSLYNQSINAEEIKKLAWVLNSELAFKDAYKEEDFKSITISLLKAMESKDLSKKGIKNAIGDELLTALKEFFEKIFSLFKEQHTTKRAEMSEVDSILSSSLKEIQGPIMSAFATFDNYKPNIKKPSDKDLQDSLPMFCQVVVDNISKHTGKKLSREQAKHIKDGIESACKQLVEEIDSNIKQMAAKSTQFKEEDSREILFKATAQTSFSKAVANLDKGMGSRIENGSAASILRDSVHLAITPKFVSKIENQSMPKAHSL